MEIDFTRQDLIFIYGRILEELTRWELGKDIIDGGDRIPHLKSLLEKIEDSSPGYDWKAFGDSMKKTYLTKLQGR